MRVCSLATFGSKRHMHVGRYAIGYRLAVSWLMAGKPFVCDKVRSRLLALPHRLAPMLVVILAVRPSTCVCARYDGLDKDLSGLACSSVAAMLQCCSDEHGIHRQFAAKSVLGSIELSLGHVFVHVGAYEKHPCRAMFAVQSAVVSSHQLLRGCISGIDSKN